MKKKRSPLVVFLLVLDILVALAILGMIAYGFLRDRQEARIPETPPVTEAPAETPAPTPEPTEPPVETPAPQPIDYYRDILSRYAAATAAKTGPEELSSGGLNPFMAYSYGENGQEHIGYLLRDIDQDGTEELLIGFLTGDMYTDQIVLELYALENGNVTKVFSSGERDRYYLCSDSMIANEASSSAYDSYYAYYDYTDGALRLREKIGFDMAANRTDPWYREAADSSRSVIQEEEAISLTNAVRSTYISAPYIPFSSYS